MHAATKFQRARIALILDQPFFGSLLMQLKATPSVEFKTMATDGINLYWNPEFVDKLPEAQVVTVLAHEVLHCALSHMTRRGSRKPRLWNIATDHAVNLTLDESNMLAGVAGKAAPFQWPSFEVYKEQRFSGMAAEEIYAILDVEPPSGDGQGQEKGQGQEPAPGKGDKPEDIGAVLDAPGQTPDEKQSTEAQWRVAVQQAAALAKGQGKLPASIARLVDEQLNPKPGWKERLRRFIRDHSRDDYSWRQPNRRYCQSGFILPSLFSERLGRIAISIDTSGSIDEQLLNEFLSEVEGIVSEARPSGIELFDCDAAVNHRWSLEPTDPLPREFTGGGGTDFRPVFDAVARDAESPACLIYLTDLWGTFPDSEPAFPVLWATTESRNAPFGEIVELRKGQ